LDVPSTYEINQPPKEPQVTGHGKFVRIGMAVSGVLVAANVVSAVLFQARMNDLTNVQQTQIHQLYQANSRLAGQLSAQSTQLGQVSAGLATENPSLITCRDLKNMALTAITGGSVSAVPGNVSLSTNTIPLPGHCKK
jgi:hypothetical protein